MNINLVGLVVVFVIIIISMVLHEMAHAYTAYWLGDTTAKEQGRLSPNPLVHLDPWMSIVLPLAMYLTSGVVFGGVKPVPINTRKIKGGAWGMALVALAGPLTNFILAFVSFLIGYYTGFLNDNGVLGLIFTELVIANLGFCVFNLIPIPPLDGSRLVYAIAPDGIREIMEKMEHTVGIMVVVFVMIFFGTALSQFTSSVMLGILRFFLMLVGAA